MAPTKQQLNYNHPKVYRPVQMFIKRQTIDDILHRVYELLLTRGKAISPGKGPALELVGVMIELRKPRARISRTETRSLLFGGLGELFWYLSGSDSVEFIRHYLPNYPVKPDLRGRITSAYGPRLISKKNGINQIENVIDVLRTQSDSRRAVIQLFDAKDILGRLPEAPCTCTIQFFKRKNRLHTLVNMRSNDAFVGLPSDIFVFTMLQELLARSVGAEIGSYKHCVGSLHLYDCDRLQAQKYIAEGWQSTIQMPPMPFGDPWPDLRKVLYAEKRVRQDSLREIPKSIETPYWADIVRLLQIYARSKVGDAKTVRKLTKAMSTDVFNVYIAKRHLKALRLAENQRLPLQRELFEL